MTNPTLQVVDGERFGTLAAEKIAEGLQEALNEHERVNLVLTGGRAASVVYSALADSETLTIADWSRVRFFWGDERCVPPDHADSNYRMAVERLLNPLGISEETVFRIRGEEEPVTAAKSYSRVVDEDLDCGRQIHVLLLGMGEDGHTASLFPGTTALDELKVSVTENYVPRLGAWRITMTKPVLKRAQRTFVLVRGSDKASVLNCVFAGQCTQNECPVRLLWKSEGEVVWISDVPLHQEC